MTLRFGFILTNFILYVFGITALLISEALTPPLVIFCLLLFLVLFIAELKEKIPIITGKHFWGYYIGPFALIISYFVFNLPIFDSLCYFLLVLLFTRIVFKKETNDYIFCYVLSLACLVIGAMGTAEFSFAFIFIAFFIVISWSMIFYHLRKENEDNLKLKNPADKYTLYDENVLQNEKIGASFFSLTSALVLGSLVITLIIFFLMPRLGKGYMTLYGRTRQAVSGFSNEVELGDIGKIKLDHSVVMRIETIQNQKKIEPGNDIYWRGIALDNYDGKRWSNTFSKRKKVEKIGKNNYKFSNRKKYSDILKQIIYLEPIGSDVIFTAGRPLNLNGSFQRIGIDFNNNIFRSKYPLGRVRLVIDSDISRKGRYRLSPDENDLMKTDREKYLQLPPLSNQFLELTHNIIEGVENKHKQAATIESYLKTNLGYTLDLTISKGISPIDNFLFVKKEGHCEYFASTMVLMLRTLGIPTRLVNGFLRGEWNQVGEYLLVRQSHAHSWIEAMLDNKGWVIFDPTPAAAIPFISNSFQTNLSHFWDNIRMKWYRYIINFSWQDQRDVAINVRNKSIKIKEKFSYNFSEVLEYFRRGRKDIRPEKIVLYVVAFVFLMVLWKKIIPLIQFTKRKKKYYQGKSLKIYLKMLTLLKKKGFEKKETDTPREFARQIKKDVGPEWEKIQLITDEYYETRFGHRELFNEKKLELYLKALSNI